jgi:hypothetical protein
MSAGFVLVMLVVGVGAVVLAGFGLGSCRAQASSAAQPGTSDDAREIPADYLALYQKTGREYRIPWNVLAAIGKVESDHGRYPGPGIRSGANYAGAAGPMQIGIGGAAGDSWSRYAVDGDGDGRKSVYDPADAIATAARILIEDKGYRRDPRTAVRRYNGSGPAAEAYADRVMNLARRYAQGDFDIGAPDLAGVACADSGGFINPAPQSVNARQCRSQPMGPENITACMRQVRDLIRARFGPLKTIGCYRTTGDPQDHARGRACDFMVSVGTMPSAEQTQVGYDIANWAAANAGKLGIRYVIWRQRIWNIERAREGWRTMENRGGITANHYDHVHISVY